MMRRHIIQPSTVFFVCLPCNFNSNEMLKNLSTLIVASFCLLSSVVAQNAVDLNSNSIKRHVTIGTKADWQASVNHAGHDHADGERCAQYTKTQALMEANPQYRDGVLAAREETRRVMAELESGVRAAPPVYTVPVVFHVIHKGETAGTGTNISSAQLQSAIDALNRDYRRTSADGGIAQGAGPDTEIQFCLASVDENGDPHSGINRVNGTGVIGYSSNGITARARCGRNYFRMYRIANVD